MLTSEPELHDAVDLCRPDGRQLNPAARGWSRRPVHRANLRGGWGRTKRWDYWAVLTETHVISVTYADIDYLGLVAVGWIDLETHRHGGHTATVPLARGISLPEHSGTAPLHYVGKALSLEIGANESEAGTRIAATWSEPGGARGMVEVAVADPLGHESLNVVIPWSDTRFQFTSKHQARPAVGRLEVDGVTHQFGGPEVQAWGVLDVGRGRWPYATRWNWAGGAGRVGGVPGADVVVGIQLGGKWTEGTGFTENGVIIDGRLVKIGAELDWDYDWDDPLRPWRARLATGELDLTLHPVHDRHESTNALVLSTEVHQVFGHWTGTIPDGAGGTLAVDGLLGFAEESRSRW
jgi:hypothetical protein